MPSILRKAQRRIAQVKHWCPSCVREDGDRGAGESKHVYMPTLLCVKGWSVDCDCGERLVFDEGALLKELSDDLRRVYQANRGAA